MEGSKVCSKCGMEKSVNEFYKDTAQKSGYYPSCKPCKLITSKEVRDRYAKLETREMKEKKVCSGCKQQKNVSEYQKNKCQKDGMNNECRECVNRRYRMRSKARRQYDPKYKLVTNLRSRMGAALRGKPKSQTTKQLIGVDFEIFTKWVEFQLEEGMTMQNYGPVWQLDHVLPISSFNLLDEEELFQAMNWVNIRPLTPIKNMQKYNKIDRWLYVMQEVKAHYFVKHLEER